MLVDNRSAEKTVVLQRLYVLEDQLRALSQMIEEDTPCTHVLTQLASVRRDLAGLAMTIVEARFREAIVDAFDSESIESSVIECREVMKYSKR